MTEPGEITELDWEQFGEDDDGVRVIEIDGRNFRLPYQDIVPQNVELSSLSQSIAREGIQTPIIVEEESDAVIDGMTRIYIAHQLGLSIDEIPIEYTKMKSEREAWRKAIELNTNRRQMTPTMRREMVEEIVERAGWGSPSSHVTELAKMLGVSKSTISRDLDRVYGSEEEHELKVARRKLNQAISGLQQAIDVLVKRTVDYPVIPADEKADRVEELKSIKDCFELARDMHTKRLREECDW